MDVGESVKSRSNLSPEGVEKGGGPKGEAQNFALFSLSRKFHSFFSLGVFSWNFGLTSRHKTQRADEETQLPIFEWHEREHETATHLDFDDVAKSPRKFSCGEAQPRWQRFAHTEWTCVGDVPTLRHNHSKHRELVIDPASSSEQRESQLPTLPTQPTAGGRPVRCGQPLQQHVTRTRVGTRLLRQIVIWFTRKLAVLTRQNG